jgi:hypothetical protein
MGVVRFVGEAEVKRFGGLLASFPRTQTLSFVDPSLLGSMAMV